MCLLYTYIFFQNRVKSYKYIYFYTYTCMKYNKFHYKIYTKCKSKTIYMHNTDIY